MKNIMKNRFLTFLMWLIPISLCGKHWAIVWLVVQIALCKSEKKEYKKRQIPLWEREDILALNKDIKLDENYVGRVRVKEGVYTYQSKQKKERKIIK